MKCQYRLIGLSIGHFRIQCTANDACVACVEAFRWVDMAQCSRVLAEKSPRVACSCTAGCFPAHWFRRWASILASSTDPCYQAKRARRVLPRRGSWAMVVVSEVGTRRHSQRGVVSVLRPAPVTPGLRATLLVCLPSFLLSLRLVPLFCFVIFFIYCLLFVSLFICYCLMHVSSKFYVLWSSSTSRDLWVPINCHWPGKMGNLSAANSSNVAAWDWYEMLVSDDQKLQLRKLRTDRRKQNARDASSKSKDCMQVATFRNVVALRRQTQTKSKRSARGSCFEPLCLQLSNFSLQSRFHNEDSGSTSVIISCLPRDRAYQMKQRKPFGDGNWHTTAHQ